MSVIEEEAPPGNGNGNGHVGLTATGDPVPPVATPLILNDAYFELTGVNLRCLTKHLEVMPENKLVTVTTFCNETDYPGVTKWHLKVTFNQSFDVGAVYDTLEAAYQAYQLDGTPADFVARGYASRPVGPGNPAISGAAIPQPFELLLGDAGAASECKIDWSLTAPPAVDSVGGGGTARQGAARDRANADAA
jgi:hypothetical protein